jgi:chemotaxis protein methyltransferase CheR
MLNFPLNDSTFKDIRDFIYDKSGIFISDTKKYLIENRLSRIVKENNLGSFGDYLHLLQHSKNGIELNRLFDAVTTNETFFYREPQQLQVFIDGIIPALMKQKKGSASLKIWSAACSTGEEPYTISMMLLEKNISPGAFEIYASDISEGVLDSAKNAVYNSYSVRNVPPHCLSKYFSSNGQNYTLDPKVRKNVKFMKANLVEEKNLKAFKGVDAIFCRNVLIYFDIKAKQKAVSNLYNNLNPGGYLFIGTSESLHNITRALRPSVIETVVTYQKI